MSQKIYCDNNSKDKLDLYFMGALKLNIDISDTLNTILYT